MLRVTGTCFMSFNIKGKSEQNGELIVSKFW